MVHSIPFFQNSLALILIFFPFNIEPNELNKGKIRYNHGLKGMLPTHYVVRLLMVFTEYLPLLPSLFQHFTKVFVWLQYKQNVCSTFSIICKVSSPSYQFSIIEISVTSHFFHLSKKTPLYPLCPNTQHCLKYRSRFQDLGQSLSICFQWGSFQKKVLRRGFHSFSKWLVSYIIYWRLLREHYKKLNNKLILNAMIIHIC